jgi:hypothetical protein
LNYLNLEREVCVESDAVGYMDECGMMVVVETDSP